MAKVRREIKKAPVAQKIDKGRQLITGCTANTALPGITNALTAFTAANGQLDTDNTASDAAAQSALRATAKLSDSDAAWNTAFEKLATAAEDGSGGASDALQSGNFDVYERGAGAGGATPSGSPAPGGGRLPAKVENMHVTSGDMPGQLEPAWNGVQPRPLLYVLRMGTGAVFDESQMHEIAMPSGSRYVVTDLTSGTKYWFQACAVGTGNTRGPWSEPAHAIAP
jgi:hypothetical protein